ncbi:MAG TPA: S-layer homology domain-containing protein, partial [Chloroflexota bacterium]|nr:S-layer homology domain-containing protein [Chloroflexota bacterium]
PPHPLIRSPSAALPNKTAVFPPLLTPIRHHSLPLWHPLPAPNKTAVPPPGTAVPTTTPTSL